MELRKLKLIGGGVALLLIFITVAWLNPFSYNDGGERTVVQTAGGDQFVRFQSGIFWAGFFAQEFKWPNQISVTYMDTTADLDLEDNGIEIGEIGIMFNDGLSADIKGVTQFILPNDEKTMITLHNIHKSAQSLVTKRLMPYTKECMQGAAQLMSSDKHYGGGRTQMSQDFLDQLRHGVFLTSVDERVYYDSIEKETKRVYLAEIRKDKNGVPQRKKSALEEFDITVADGSAYDAKYSPKFYAKIEKIVDATTKAAVSRQNLMTAQQEALTKKAEGERELIEIEYKQKQDQTKQVVEAETKVKVAQQDKIQQQIAYEAAILEAKKRTEIANVAAYEKRTQMQADGALTQKLDAYIKVQTVWATNFGLYKGNITPLYQTGGASSNGAINFMEIMAAKSAKDLMLDLNTKD